MIRYTIASRRLSARVSGGVRLVIPEIASPSVRPGERPPWADRIGIVETVVVTLRSPVVARREINGFFVNSVAVG